MKDCDLVEVTQMAINIFQHDYIVFSSNEAHIFHKMDRTQWIRVITNLIQNALHSVSKKKTPQIGVQIVSEPTNHISITDNGSGIPDKLKSKIFEPKFTTKTAGMGLGLGIVKNIIKSHKGKIIFCFYSQKGNYFFYCASEGLN